MKNIDHNLKRGGANSKPETNFLHSTFYAEPV